MSPPEEPRFSYLQGLLVLQLEAQHLSKASSLCVAKAKAATPHRAGPRTVHHCRKYPSPHLTNSTISSCRGEHKDIPANAKKTCAPP
ncbi:hypothetical protein PC117_g12887 [Phytophthora cactorum]|uniref:Uncharacterized protein n=1 Tax=Phytophthora cactorum TaxID=29920 RepID=A0A8T1D509_9STRA|nr:hypothetical protein PC117_g12887 [Phytophthora cactorum]